MPIAECIESIQQNIKFGRFTNEAAVSQGAILPLLQALGWPTINTRVVAPEYTVSGRRVDYALCYPEDKPKIFIEAKRLGNTSGAERQLFEYAFHLGIQMAILTDGQEWHFYLPAEQGDYQNRRVYKLDLLERNIDESSKKLKRYLSYKFVCKGDAIKFARSDYKDISRNREIKKTIPEAWQNLIGEPDEILLELLAEKVADLCGFKPDLDACASYIESMNKLERLPESKVFNKSIGSKNPTYNKKKKSISESFAFSFKGNRHTCASAKDVLVKIFSEFAQREESFLERFTARKHGTKRRFVDRDIYKLYYNRPDLSENFSQEFHPGWFIGTNYSKREIEKIIRMACEVSGLAYGSDITIEL